MPREEKKIISSNVMRHFLILFPTHECVIPVLLVLLHFFPCTPSLLQICTSSPRGGIVTSITIFKKQISFFKLFSKKDLENGVRRPN